MNGRKQGDVVDSKLIFLFQVILYVGIGLPLVNLLLGLIGGLGDASPSADTDLSPDGELDLDTDVDFDAELDLDADVGLDTSFEVAGDAGAHAAAGGDTLAGDSHGFFVRFNVYCLCLGMVVLGAFGIFAVARFSGLWQAVMIAVGAVLAIAAYILLYRLLILPLKKNDAAALRTSRLRYKHAIVTFRIKNDSPGKVRTTDAVGATITYQAEIDTDLSKRDLIEEGEEVVITDLNLADGLCYVIPAQRNILNGGNV